MKKDVLIFSILNIIASIVLLILNLSTPAVFIINLVLLFIFLISTLYRKITLFALVLFAMFYLLKPIIINSNNSIVLMVYLILLILNGISSFVFIFNLHNNGLNIQFRKLKFPTHPNYLVIKYMSGPIKGGNLNSIVSLNDNYYLIETEDKNQITDSLKIGFNDIKNIEIIEKPYHKSTIDLTNYEVDITRSSLAGRSTGTFERVKSSKMIRSYEITITLNDNEIKLVAFDLPSIFDPEIYKK